MEALDLLTVPKVTAHFKVAADLCSEVAPSFPEMQLEPVAVLGLSNDRKLVLSDPAVAVKRDGQLVCLWSQRTAREKLQASEISRSLSPISRRADESPEPNRSSVRRIPSLSSLASGGRVNHAGLTAALADLREENSRLKLEMSNFRGERSQTESDSRPSEEIRSLRRRLMTLEKRVSVERGLLAKKMQELDEREEALNLREASVGRKERLAHLEQSIPLPSPRSKPTYSRPRSANSNNVDTTAAHTRRRSKHAWR